MGKDLGAAEQAGLAGAVSKLREQLDEALAENRRLAAKVADLEREKQQMRQSVLQFREELSRSILVGPPPSPSRRPGPGSPVESSTRSPSPDVHEYIRNLERKVELQQQRLDEYARFYRKT